MSVEAIVAPYTMMGQAVGFLGSALETATADLHRQAAEEQMLTRDANGKPQVERRMLELTAGDRAFNAVVAQRALAQGSNELSRAAAEGHQKYPNDPAGFDAFWSGVTKTVATTGDRLMRGPLAAEADRIGTAHRNNIVNTQGQQTIANTKIELSSKIGQELNVLTQLARAGQEQSGDFSLARDRLGDLFKTLTGNPAYGVPQAKADEDLARITESLKHEAMVGRIDRIYDEKNAVGAREFVRSELAKPGSHLTDADRARLTSTAEARIQFREGQRREEVAVNRKGLDALVKAAQEGKPIPAGAWDEPIARAERWGDTEGLATARWTRLLFGEGGTLTGLQTFPQAARDILAGRSPAAGSASAPSRSPPPELASQISKASQQYGISELFLTRTAWIESRFDPNAQHPGSKASGTFQFIPSTWKSYGGGASPFDQGANVDAAARLARDNAARLRSGLGRDPTDGELYLAHQQGAAGALNLLRAPNVSAASVVGERAVTANGGTPGMTAGQFAQLWIGKFDKGAGTQIVPGGSYATRPAGAPGGGAIEAASRSPNRYDLPAALAAMGVSEAQRIKEAQSLADSVLSGLKAGQMPSVEHGAIVAQAAVQYPEQLGKKATEIAAQLGGMEVVDTLGGMSPSSGQQRLAEIKSLAQGSSDVFGQAVVRVADEWYTKREKAMAEDAIAAGASSRWYPPVAPLDFSSATSISRGVAEHGAAAETIMAQRGLNAQSAFTGTTVAAVKDRVANGSLGDRVALLQAIVALPPAVMKATLASIANDEEGRVFAVAGSVARYAPQVASDILQGRFELQTNPKLAPKNDATLTDELVKELPTSDFPAEAREAIKGAAMSLYARSSTKANDTSQALNETRLKSAIQAVTGGVLESRGSKILAPFYGARQEDLDALVRGLDDNDFAGARLADGSRFPASALKPSFETAVFGGGWRLRSFGEGRYLIESGPRDAPRALMQGATDTSGASGVFVLDLAAKRERTQMPIITAPPPPAWPPEPKDQAALDRITQEIIDRDFAAARSARARP